MISWVLDAVSTADIDETIVVVGAIGLDEELEGRDVVVIENPDWEDGQATSLQVAWREADRRGHDAIVVGLGDQPMVSASAWDAVARSSSPIAVATYDNRRRNPVRLAKQVWPLLPDSGDEGARSVVRVRPDLVVEIPCQGHADDIDTLEDLRRWN